MTFIVLLLTHPWADATGENPATGQQSQGDNPKKTDFKNSKGSHHPQQAWQPQAVKQVATASWQK
jgi:hypothetical protein